MKKKSFTLVLLVVILLCVVLSACNKDGSKPVVLTEEQKEFYTNWMEAIKDDTPINSKMERVCPLQGTPAPR